MPDNRPLITEKIDLDLPIDTRQRTLIQGTDATLRVKFCRGVIAEDTTGGAVELNVYNANGGDPWARTFTGTATNNTGEWDIAITASGLDLAGTHAGEVELTDASGYVIINQLIELTVQAKVGTSPTPPVGNVIDWSDYTGYLATAASGPYTAGTYIAFGTADGNGRVPISVSAHAASHATGGSDPLTAADIGAVGLTGSQTMEGQLIISEVSHRLRLRGTDTAGLLAYENSGGTTKYGQWIIAPNGDVTFDCNAAAGGRIAFRTTPDGDGSAVAVTIQGTGLLRALKGAAATYLQAIDATGISVQDSTGTEHAIVTSTGLRVRPRVVSGNITAELDGVYHVTASATISDPGTPAEGRGYTVLVVNGTATVNSIGYAVAGTVIRRVYHSGAWQTVRVYLPPGKTITESGTTRTLGRADVGQMIRLTNAGACTITVPANATTAFEDGDTIMFRVTTVSPAALTLGDGVTVNNGSAITSLPQHSTFALRRTSTTDVWDLI